MFNWFKNLFTSKSVESDTTKNWPFPTGDKPAANSTPYKVESVSEKAAEAMVKSVAPAKKPRKPRAPKAETATPAKPKATATKKAAPKTASKKPAAIKAPAKRGRKPKSSA